MKNYLTISVLATAAALVSLSAQAQTAPLTRAQVAAELAQARASGALERMASEGFGFPTPLIRKPASPSAPAAAAARQEGAPQPQTRVEPQPEAQSGLTRAEVKAELARARAAGEMDFAAAEVNGTSPYEARKVPAPAYARRGAGSVR